MWIDTIAFERRVAPALAAWPAHTALAMRNRMRKALRLYRGDFFPSHDEEWVLLERERLRCLQLDTLHALAIADAGAGDWASAVIVARHLCAAEPLREDGHRLLMEALARTGNRALALRQYRICAAVLARELGVEPMAETRALERRLSGRAPAASAAVPRRDGGNDLRAALVASRQQVALALGTIDKALSEN
ncbi:MAG: AfsR/SARP family transcriptional regulator [Hypericibacter sp.]